MKINVKNKVESFKKRKPTTKNSKNTEILNFLEESSGNIKDEKFEKTAQKKIRDSNKILREHTKFLKKTYSGYHDLNKKNNEDINKSNKFRENNAFDNNNLFDNINMHSKIPFVNPPLQNNRFNLEVSQDGNLTNYVNNLKQKNKEIKNKFRTLGSNYNTISQNTILMPTSEIIKIFGWHEARLNKYKEALEFCQNKFDEISNYNKFLEKRLIKLENDTVFTDYQTLLLRDVSIRKIQSTWRLYKFKISHKAILVQRWYRYKKNVSDVSNDVKNFFKDIKILQEETLLAKEYLSSLNSTKALPLDKLKEMKIKIKNRLTRIKI